MRLSSWMLSTLPAGIPKGLKEVTLQWSLAGGSLTMKSHHSGGRIHMKEVGFTWRRSDSHDPCPLKKRVPYNFLRSGGKPIKRFASDGEVTFQQNHYFRSDGGNRCWALLFIVRLPASLVHIECHWGVKENVLHVDLLFSLNCHVMLHLLLSNLMLLKKNITVQCSKSLNPKWMGEKVLKLPSSTPSDGEWYCIPPTYDLDASLILAYLSKGCENLSPLPWTFYHKSFKKQGRQAAGCPLSKQIIGILNHSKPSTRCCKIYS